MAECRFLVQCPFFAGRMEAMRGVTDLMRAKYCRGDASRCARYQVRTALGPGTVPLDLYPNQHERASQLIGA